MKRLALLLTILLALVSVLWPGLSPAENYYVSTDSCADNANSGLSPKCSGSDGPWGEIQYGLDQLEPGDTLSLAPGVYKETWNSLEKAGEQGNPITLASLEPGKAVLDGAGASGGACGLFLEKGAAHLVIKGLVIQNMGGNGIASDEDAEQPFRDITVSGCLLKNNALSGMELAAVDGFLVEDSVFENNGYYGLNVTGSKDGSLSSANGNIKNCSFKNHVGPEGHGFAINQGHDIVVEECRAEHNRVHGFDVSDWPKRGQLSSRVLFRHNFSHDNGKAGFAVNSDSSHVTYLRNVAWGNGAAWAGAGLAPGFWCYEGCRDCTWQNNTAVDNSLSGFHVEDSAGVYDGKGPATALAFINNIGWDNGQAKWGETYGLLVSKAGWKLTLSNNDFGSPKGGSAKVVGLDMSGDKGQTFTAKEVEAGALGPGNISRDPDFRDQGGDDFSLAPDSPLLDMGAPAGEKHCGAAPDIGAFEHCP